MKLVTMENSWETAVLQAQDKAYKDFQQWVPHKIFPQTEKM